MAIKFKKNLEYFPESLPCHYEALGLIVKAWPCGAGDGVAVDFGSSDNTVQFKNRHQAMNAIRGYFFFPDIEVGACDDLVINQNYRDVEVIQVNRTRARIEYEMPSAGFMQGWIPIFKTPHGKAHAILDNFQLDRGY